MIARKDAECGWFSKRPIMRWRTTKSVDSSILTAYEHACMCLYERRHGSFDFPLQDWDTELLGFNAYDFYTSIVRQAFNPSVPKKYLPKMSVYVRQDQRLLERTWEDGMCHIGVVVVPTNYEMESFFTIEVSIDVDELHRWLRYERKLSKLPLATMSEMAVHSADMAVLVCKELYARVHLACKRHSLSAPKKERYTLQPCDDYESAFLQVMQQYFCDARRIKNKTQTTWSKELSNMASL